jgi:hypothetical protein
VGPASWPSSCHDRSSPSKSAQTLSYEHEVEGMVALAKGKCQRAELHLKLTERVTFDVKITSDFGVKVRVTLSNNIKDTRPTISDFENQISSLWDQISSLQSERASLIGLTLALVFFLQRLLLPDLVDSGPQQLLQSQGSLGFHRVIPLFLAHSLTLGSVITMTRTVGLAS